MITDKIQIKAHSFNPPTIMKVAIFTHLDPHTVCM